MSQQPPKAPPVEISDLEIETRMIRDAVGPENFEKAIQAGTLGTISQEAKDIKRRQLQIEAQKASDEAWWASPDGRRAQADKLAAEADRLAEDSRKARLILEQDQRYADVDLDAMSQAELLREAGLTIAEEDPKPGSGYTVETPSDAAEELARNWWGWSDSQKREHIERTGLTEDEVRAVATRRSQHSFQ